MREENDDDSDPSLSIGRETSGMSGGHSSFRTTLQSIADLLEQVTISFKVLLLTFLGEGLLFAAAATVLPILFLLRVSATFGHDGDTFYASVRFGSAVNLIIF